MIGRREIDGERRDPLDDGMVGQINSLALASKAHEVTILRQWTLIPRIRLPLGTSSCKAREYSREPLDALPIMRVTSGLMFCEVFRIAIELPDRHGLHDTAFVRRPISENEQSEVATFPVRLALEQQ